VPDEQKFAAWLKSDADAPFPVLTDMDNGYAISLGLAIYVGGEMKKMMLGQGFDPSMSQGTENWMLPIPATFVVGTTGPCTRALSIRTIGRAWPSRTCWPRFELRGNGVLTQIGGAWACARRCEQAGWSADCGAAPAFDATIVETPATELLAR
jgi:hypothetical protein